MPCMGVLPSAESGVDRPRQPRIRSRADRRVLHDDAIQPIAARARPERAVRARLKAYQLGPVRGHVVSERIGWSLYGLDQQSGNRRRRAQQRTEEADHCYLDGRSPEVPVFALGDEGFWLVERHEPFLPAVRVVAPDGQVAVAGRPGWRAVAGLPGDRHRARPPGVMEPTLGRPRHANHRISRTYFRSVAGVHPDRVPAVLPAHCWYNRPTPSGRLRRIVGLGRERPAQFTAPPATPVLARALRAQRARPGVADLGRGCGR